MFIQSDFYIFGLNSMNADCILKVLKTEDVLEWDIFHIKITDSNELVFDLMIGLVIVI